jgi:hypothetical protein
MLAQLGKGLLGRLLGYGGLFLGFWLLFQGFSRPNPLLGILGGGAILGGMYLMVATRRSPTTPFLGEPEGEARGNGEDNPSAPPEENREQNTKLS